MDRKAMGMRVVALGVAAVAWSLGLGVARGQQVQPLTTCLNNGGGPNGCDCPCPGKSSASNSSTVKGAGPNASTPQSSPVGSLIDNMTANHIHDATDWEVPQNQPGCKVCGGGTVENAAAVPVLVNAKGSGVNGTKSSRSPLIPQGSPQSMTRLCH